MSQPVPQKAVYAPIEYVKFGEGASKNFGFTRQVTIAMTAGLLCSLAWKTWHWNEKRNIAQFYFDLAKREKAQEDARKKTIEAKYKQLEDELLA